MTKKIYSAIIMILALVISLTLVLSMEMIRPANQLDSRGVGEQIRPANQINQPLTGNGDYAVTQGAYYSSLSTFSDDHDPDQDNYRPANQRSGRGVDKFVRPAHHNDLPEESKGDYVPDSGSDYSSGYLSASSMFILSTTLTLSSDINQSALQQGSGDGFFVLDKRTNTLTYDIVYEGLSSNETSSHIHGPASTSETAGVLYSLPLGNQKQGMIFYDQSVEAFILGGSTYVNIHSLMFPQGELRGQIMMV